MGLRLDNFLVSNLNGYSRSRLQKLVKSGNVKCQNEYILDPAFRLKSGEIVSLVVSPAEVSTTPAQSMKLNILFEDDDVLVLEKPAGLVVHPAPGHADATLVNALLAHCGESLSGIGGIKRPGIVHRLDKDVSGVMVVAKNDRAHVRLASQFSIHSIDRRYEALVWGLPESAAGTIEGAIGRHPRDRKRMAMVQKGGKPAKTTFRVISTSGTYASKLEFRLETGRTHQIRVHSTFLGHPILGDTIYCPRRMPFLSEAVRAELGGFKRIALHAKQLGFDHPATGNRLTFEVPVPEAFDRLFACLAS